LEAEEGIILDPFGSSSFSIFLYRYLTENKAGNTCWLLTIEQQASQFLLTVQYFSQQVLAHT